MDGFRQKKVLQMKDKIIKDIEKLSGYSFQDFQTRCKIVAYDCSLVMQQIKSKYRRTLTGEFIQNELGLSHRFADEYKRVRDGTPEKYDPGFTVKYIQELQRQVDALKGTSKKYKGVQLAKHSASYFREAAKRKMYS
jgi:hypothetical protein